MTTGNGEVPRAKRTVLDIRAAKRTGEKFVYMSVPDYTSARWAEMAGVDVAVVGDSLAMVAHGHPSTIPATMDMMILHAQAVRRGAPNTFVLGCMPYQSYSTVDRALVRRAGHGVDGARRADGALVSLGVHMRARWSSHGPTTGGSPHPAAPTTDRPQATGGV